MGKTAPFIKLVNVHRIDPKIVFDVGCYSGHQSLELAEAWPEAKVYAFEAAPEIAAAALNNTASNPRIGVIPCAVSDRDGLAVFNKSISGNAECGSLLVPNGEYFEPMPTRQIIVPTMRLDTAIRELKLPKGPDVIWMDVQGFELQALKGMGHHLINVSMIWAEVAYRAYYQNQILESEFDSAMAEFGFVKIYSSPGIPGWFGDCCYKRP